MKLILVVLFMIVFVVGFGLLPLWASALFVYLESLKPNAGAEYWSAAPWLVIAAFPLCAFTLGVVAITCAVYALSQPRKLKRAVACFMLLSLVLVVGAAGYWWRHTARDARMVAEKDAVRAFVEEHSEINRAIPGKRRAYPGISMVARDSWASRYIYSVSPADDVGSPSGVYAVVDVSRGSGFGAPVFSLACVFPRDEYKRRTGYPGADPCRSGG